jgi:lipoprotein
MKKLLLAAVTVVSLTACSRNNGTDEQQTFPLVGTWKYVRTEIISGADASTLYTGIPNECESKSTLEFKEDGRHIDNEFIELGIGGRCVNDGDWNSKYEYNPITKILNITYSNGSVEQKKVLLLDATNLYIITREGHYDSDKIKDKEVKFYVRQN